MVFSLKRIVLMIELTHGDILKADAEALVNTVNTVGVMGRGIALQFKNAFPANFKVYKAACDRGEVRPGRMFVYDLGHMTNPRYIINFPTKVHWKNRSRLADIESGLAALREEIIRLDIRSIAIPPLGCGLGGLNWIDVRPRIERAFADMPDVHVLLYEPGSAPPPEAMVKPVSVPKMTIGRAVLVSLMYRYLAALMDTSVSLLELHKLMYFMQESGELLQLQYTRGPYGPYAENLRHVLRAIDGHLIVGYGDGEDNPEKPIQLKGDVLDRAQMLLTEHRESEGRFEKVVDLIEGFETPYGMELLATVHWLAVHENVDNPDDAIREAHAWSDRKRDLFRDRHILVAWNVLSEKGWLS